MIIVKIIVVALTEPITAWLKAFLVILLKAMGMTNAPKAPKAAASVGVAKPIYIDPITVEARIINAQSGRMDAHRSFQV